MPQVEGEFDEEWLVWVEARVTFKNEQLGIETPLPSCHLQARIAPKVGPEVRRDALQQTPPVHTKSVLRAFTLKINVEVEDSRIFKVSNGFLLIHIGGVLASTPVFGRIGGPLRRLSGL